jgi:hypothetical protein
MNIRPVVPFGLPWYHRTIDRPGCDHDVGRFRDVWFGRLFDHGVQTCNADAERRLIDLVIS